MNYPGIRLGPVISSSGFEKGEVVDPATHYFRIAPFFETAPLNITGSIAGSQLGLVIAEPRGRSTVFSKCYELHLTCGQENSLGKL
jgi:hypothetical protein